MAVSPCISVWAIVDSYQLWRPQIMRHRQTTDVIVSCGTKSNPKSESCVQLWELKSAWWLVLKSNQRKWHMAAQRHNSCFPPSGIYFEYALVVWKPPEPQVCFSSLNMCKVTFESPDKSALILRLSLWESKLRESTLHFTQTRLRGSTFRAVHLLLLNYHARLLTGNRNIPVFVPTAKLWICKWGD